MRSLLLSVLLLPPSLAQLSAWCNSSSGVEHDGRCFVLGNNTRNWDDAHTECATLPDIPAGYRGRLAIISDFETYTAILPPPFTTELLWVAIKASGNNTAWSGFGWWDGKDKLIGCARVHELVYPMRDDYLGGGHCVPFNPKNRPWRAAGTCINTYLPYCEILPASISSLDLNCTCDDPTCDPLPAQPVTPITSFCKNISGIEVLGSGHCYKEEVNDAKSFDDAFAHCQAMPGIPAGNRGRLAVVDTKALADALIPMAIMYAWTAMRSSGTGDTITIEGQAWWDMGKPKECVHLQESAARIDWGLSTNKTCTRVGMLARFTSSDCSYLCGFLCEFLPDTTDAAFDQTHCDCTKTECSSETSPDGRGRLAAVCSGGKVMLSCEGQKTVSMFSCEGGVWNPALNDSACPANKTSTSTSMTASSTSSITATLTPPSITTSTSTAGSTSTSTTSSSLTGDTSSTSTSTTTSPDTEKLLSSTLSTSSSTKTSYQTNATILTTTTYSTLQSSSPSCATSATASTRTTTSTNNTNATSPSSTTSHSTIMSNSSSRVEPDPIDNDDCFRRCNKLVIEYTCYAMLTGATTERAAAESRCTVAGGALAVIRRESDWKQIIAAGLDNGFIGLVQDDGSPNPAANWAWRYPGGYKVSLDYVPWHQGQPDSGYAQYATLKDGALFDDRLAVTANPICMYNYTVPSDAVMHPAKAGPVDRTGGKCFGSEGSRTVNGQCYALLPFRGSHDAAEANCREHGGILATFTSAADLFMIAAEWGGWIGLERQCPSSPRLDFEWRMPDGKLVRNSLDVWIWGNPNAGNERHVLLRKDGAEDYPSNHHSRAICQWDFSSPNHPYKYNITPLADCPLAATSAPYLAISNTPVETQFISSTQSMGAELTGAPLTSTTSSLASAIAFVEGQRAISSLSDLLARIDQSLLADNLTATKQLIMFAITDMDIFIPKDCDYAAEGILKTDNCSTVSEEDKSRECNVFRKACLLTAKQDVAGVISAGLANPLIPANLEKDLLESFDSSIPVNVDEMSYFEEEPIETRVREAAVAQLRKVAAEGSQKIQASEDLLMRLIAASMAFGERKNFTSNDSDFIVAKDMLSNIIAERIYAREFSIEFPSSVCSIIKPCEEDFGVVMKLAYKKGNLFEYADDRDYVNTGSLDNQLFREIDFSELQVKNTSSPISMTFTNQPQSQSEAEKEPVVHRYSPFVLHPLIMTKYGQSFTIKIAIEDPMALIEAYVRFNEAPLPLPGFFDQFESAKSGSILMKLSGHPYNGTGTLFLGIGQFAEHQSNHSSRIPVANENGTVAYYEKQLSTSYRLEMFTSGCYFFDEKSGIWSDRGCKVGPESNITMTQCLCDHLASFK